MTVHHGCQQGRAVPTCQPVAAAERRQREHGGGGASPQGQRHRHVGNGIEERPPQQLLAPPGALHAGEMPGRAGLGRYPVPRGGGAPLATSSCAWGPHGASLFGQQGAHAAPQPEARATHAAPRHQRLAAQGAAAHQPKLEARGSSHRGGQPAAGGCSRVERPAQQVDWPRACTGSRGWACLSTGGAASIQESASRCKQAQGRKAEPTVCTHQCALACAPARAAAGAACRPLSRSRGRPPAVQGMHTAGALGTKPRCSCSRAAPPVGQAALHGCPAFMPTHRAAHGGGPRPAVGAGQERVQHVF